MSSSPPPPTSPPPSARGEDVSDWGTQSCVELGGGALSPVSHDSREGAGAKFREDEGAGVAGGAGLPSSLSLPNFAGLEGGAAISRRRAGGGGGSDGAELGLGKCGVGLYFRDKNEGEAVASVSEVAPSGAAAREGLHHP